MDKILVVDDEKGVCYSFKKILGRLGYDVITAGNGLEAIERAGKDSPSLVVMDVSMPQMDGLETLQRLKSLHPELIVIMMTAHSTSDRAITAMKFGAYDYLTKPFDNAQLISVIEKALMDKRISTPVTFDDTGDEKGDRIIGRSPAMLEIFKKIGQVSESDVTVLIRGETGTGKELLARAIYHHSKRVNKPFLPVNCAAIPENLLESELFGHEKGAFTGADNKKIGKFEQCSTGTMFLDEIGDMPLSIQAKWLRVLQDGCFQRLGGKETIKTDVRIIAATNKNLEELRDEKKFRDDLYWRLNVVSIFIPPLRERPEDLDLLVRYFIKRFNLEFSKEVKGLSPDLLKKFLKYPWPGNVRELQSVIQRGMLLCQKDVLSADDCEWPPKETVSDNKTKDIEKMLSDAADEFLKRGGANIYKEAVAVFERLLVKQAMEMNRNNQVLTAKFLGISRNTLREKIDDKPGNNLPKK
ncbi:MAG: sigma-54-dependent Fis family transcriptional regulator [Nitrospiraceae bacterium]|nr:MAG: sigma-54-dependent Fis family transcriptional regulator [Nitrospiraceae bacterium]